MNYDSVVLFSGGLDSTVLAYQLVAQGKRLRALFFDLGKMPTAQETQAAKKASFDLNIPLEIVDVSGLPKMDRGYIPFEAVVSDEFDYKINRDHYIVPVSGFPILLSAGIHYAQITSINTVHIAVIQEQTVNRPRVREFFDSFAATTRLMDDKWPEVKIETPFIDIPKKEVVILGTQLNVHLAQTWTCFFGGLNHCGTCYGCRLRKQAFIDANVVDDTIYQSM